MNTFTDPILFNSASIIIGLVFVVVASLLAYFFAPKGENQTYVSFRLTPEPSPTRLITSHAFDDDRYTDNSAFSQGLAQFPDPKLRKLLHHVGYVWALENP